MIHVQVPPNYVTPELVYQKVPPWVPPGEHYVLVTEHDGSQAAPRFVCDQYGIPQEVIPDRSVGPLTWEHYLGHATSLDAIRRRQRELGAYGRTAIARLIFLDAGPTC